MSGVDGIPMWLRWWQFKAWFHRCPECGHRPDRHYDSGAPRWENDKIARMLGIGRTMAYRLVREGE